MPPNIFQVIVGVGVESNPKDVLVLVWKVEEEVFFYVSPSSPRPKHHHLYLRGFFSGGGGAINTIRAILAFDDSLIVFFNGTIKESVKFVCL